MAAMQTPVCDFGREAVDFRLADPSGRTFTLADVRGTAATLVMFICNHCPYVQAVIDRLVTDVEALRAVGVGAVAIMANDYSRYPDDAPARMVEFARRHRLDFPYLVDETQAVARAYGAVCTPDFFGYNADLRLQYRGRIDDAGPRGSAPKVRELYEAMAQIARTGTGPAEQTASMGCSIKWRSEP
ncbi:MAG: thioredoxin family protein [Rhodospirillales bacterium]